jgi:hypothetical protein
MQYKFGLCIRHSSVGKMLDVKFSVWGIWIGTCPECQWTLDRANSSLFGDCFCKPQSRLKVEFIHNKV